MSRICRARFATVDRYDPNTIWIDANVKETDFERLKIGAPTTITIDAYPELEFQGEVTRLGHAATSQFALLPSPNPSGNFTKITQRPSAYRWNNATG